MKEADWQALGSYIEKLRNDLLLGQWEIELQRDPPESEDGDGSDASMIDAQIVITAMGFFAKIRVHPNFRQGDPNAQRATILHELMHLHLDRLYSDMLDVISGTVAPQTKAVTELLVRRAYERTCESLAQAIAPKYDLIEWPKAKSAE